MVFVFNRKIARTYRFFYLTSFLFLVLFQIANAQPQAQAKDSGGTSILTIITISALIGLGAWGLISWLRNRNQNAISASTSSTTIGTNKPNATAPNKNNGTEPQNNPGVSVSAKHKTGHFPKGISKQLKTAIKEKTALIKNIIDLSTEKISEEENSKKIFSDIQEMFNDDNANVYTDEFIQKIRKSSGLLRDFLELEGDFIEKLKELNVFEKEFFAGIKNWEIYFTEGGSDQLYTKKIERLKKIISETNTNINEAGILLLLSICYNLQKNESGEILKIEQNLEDPNMRNLILVRIKIINEEFGEFKGFISRETGIIKRLEERIQEQNEIISFLIGVVEEHS